MNADKLMGGIYPGKGLSIKQLLYALRVELTQNTSVGRVDLQAPSQMSLPTPPTSLHRPPDMTARDVLGPSFLSFSRP